MPSICEQLGRIDRSSTSRTLRLVTREQGPIALDDLPYHVQGISRVDRGDKAIFALTVSGERHGQLWMAEFDLVGGRVADEGRVLSVVPTDLPHPGGLQACGSLLAVPSEGDRGWARIEIFDISNPARPRLVDSLSLDNSLREGVSQLTGSKAGFLLFGELAPDEYLLFVGGRDFARSEGWFYRYTPRVDPAWRFEGNFVGKPRSSGKDAWGPQNAAALVCAAGEKPTLIVFGNKGSEGGDAFTPRLRAYSLEQLPGQPWGLCQEPATAPALFSLRESGLSKWLGPNPRWGSTAFVDAAGDLVCYFTARKPRPRFGDHVHVLEICELRAG